jgi:putative nucleotidyltransferase with HDIG domain
MAADLRPVKEANNVTVSIAGIAYCAALLMSPHWTTVALIAFARCVREVVQQREEVVLRATFNVACHVAWVSAAILTYSACGGIGFLAIPQPTIPRWAAIAGWAGAAAYIVGMLVNSVLTYTVVTAYVRGPAKNVLGGVWRVLWESPIQGPPIVAYAWLYVTEGPVAGLALLAVMYVFRDGWEYKARNKKSLTQMLELMVNTLEASNTYTSGHSRRVRRNCEIIARELRLPAKTQQLVSAAALLHDVGKVHDKYRPLLKKEAALTADEWDVMKQHPVDGANLLRSVDLLSDFVEPVLHHHERWDGTGYPDGVAGKDILLIARIIALGDTIDAMASARPYRPGLDAEAILAELEKCRGTQFDPAIVDVLLGNPSLVSDMVRDGRRASEPITGSHLALVRDLPKALDAMARVRPTGGLFGRSLAR